jgi:hypothetical protein
MVNPGHPSKACATCKLRRIRCDLTRPICLRCTKSKRVCLGYDVEKGLTIIDGSYGDPPNVASRDQQCAALLPIPRLQTLVGGHYCEARLASMSADVAFFLENVPIASLQTKIWDSTHCSPFFPTLPTGPDSLLLSVLDAIGAGFFALQQPIQTAGTRRIQLAKYGLATQKLRTAITTGPASPALFLAVLLFALYEVTIIVISLVYQSC